MSVAEQEIKEKVIQVLDELSDEKIKEVLDFALFLQMRPSQKEDGESAVQPSPSVVSHPVPAAQLDALTGLVAWGGDAVVDTERLYEDPS